MHACDLRGVCAKGLGGADANTRKGGMTRPGTRDGLYTEMKTRIARGEVVSYEWGKVNGEIGVGRVQVGW